VSVSAFTWAIVCKPQSARLSLCLARSSRLGGGRASRDRGQFASDTYLAQRTHTRPPTMRVRLHKSQAADGRTETLLLFSPVGNRSVCVGTTLDPIWPRAGWFHPLSLTILRRSTEEIHRFDTKTLVFGPERVSEWVSATLNACHIIYARQTHAEKLFVLAREVTEFYWCRKTIFWQIVYASYPRGFRHGNGKILIKLCIYAECKFLSDVQIIRKVISFCVPVIVMG